MHAALSVEPDEISVCAIVSPRASAVPVGLSRFKSTRTPSELLNCVQSKSYNVCVLSSSEAEALSPALRAAHPGILIVLIADKAAFAPVSASCVDVILPAGFREDTAALLAPYIQKKLIEQHDQTLVSRAAESLRARLEWLGYKESRRNLDRDSESRTIIENLRISLSQGAGFGTLLTLVDMMADWCPCGTSCHVDSEIQRLLQQNSEIARHHLEALTKIIELMSTTFEPRVHSIAEVAESLHESAALIQPFLPAKRMRLRFSLPPRDARVAVVDLERVVMAFQELLINAYKYGEEGSSIDVLWAVTHGFLTVGVKNNAPEGDPYAKEELGTLTSPFLRLHPPVEDIISVETFGLGLGLTMVEYIMVRNKGLFALSRVSDHTSASPAACTLAQLFVPLSDNQRDFK